MMKKKNHTASSCRHENISLFERVAVDVAPAYTTNKPADDVKLKGMDPLNTTNRETESTTSLNDMGSFRRRNPLSGFLGQYREEGTSPEKLLVPLSGLVQPSLFFWRQKNG